MKANKVQNKVERVDMTKIVPEGKYTGIIYSIVDLGTQTIEYKGEKKEQRKVQITREIPSIMHVFNEELGEQPVVSSKRYTFSTFKHAHLRALIETVMGKMSDEDASSFDLTELIGKYCLLQIEHNEQYVNISNIMGLSTEEELEAVEKGIKPVNETVVFDLDEPDEKDFDKLYEYLQNTIKKSSEYQAWKASDEEEF